MRIVLLWEDKVGQIMMKQRLNAPLYRKTKINSVNIKLTNHYAITEACRKAFVDKMDKINRKGPIKPKSRSRSVSTM